MKYFLTALVLITSGTFADAVQVPAFNNQVVREIESAEDAARCANRKGSRRVGGSNSKGKGSHYRGGRRK